MSRFSRLQSRLARVEARLLILEGTYDGIQELAGYERNFGELKATHQRFADVAGEYWRLLDEKAKLEDEIAALSGETDCFSAIGVSL